VIDIDPPALAGDRAFDVATLLFYLYDLDAVRGRLWTRMLELACRDAARAYLAHMVLRQVDWSLRFHPAAAATRHYGRLARRVVADIG
jgi:streptomycin 6-kinase